MLICWTRFLGHFGSHRRLKCHYSRRKGLEDSRSWSISWISRHPLDDAIRGLKFEKEGHRSQSYQKKTEEELEDEDIVLLNSRKFKRFLNRRSFGGKWEWSKQKGDVVTCFRCFDARLEAISDATSFSSYINFKHSNGS